MKESTELGEPILLTKRDNQLSQYEGELQSRLNETTAGNRPSTPTGAPPEGSTCIKCKKVICCAHGKCEPALSWVCLVAVLYVNIIIAVVDTSFGIFYDHLQEKYKTTRAGIGWGYFTFNITGSVAGLLVYPFINLYGCRLIATVSSIIFALGMCLMTFASTLTLYILTFGVIGGIGCGCTSLAASAIVQQRFSQNRGLATGISTLGFTAGTILTPVVIEVFLKNYNLEGALLLHGTLFVQGIVFAAVLKSPKEYIQRKNTERNEKGCPKPPIDRQSIDIDRDEPCIHDEDERSSLSPSPEDKLEGGKSKLKIKQIFRDMVDLSILKNVPFVLYTLHFFFLIVSRVGLLSHTVSAAIYRDISPTDAAYLFTIMGFSNLVTRSISSVVINFPQVNPALYSALGTLMLAASGLITAFARSYHTFVIAMVALGGYEGVTHTVMSMVLVYILGVEKFAGSSAILRVATIPSPLIGAPFTGWLFDKTGDYTVSFLLVGLSSVVSTIFAVAIYILKKVTHKRNRRHKNVTSKGNSMAEELGAETFVS